MNKNELGYVCMIFILFFLWSLLRVGAIPSRRQRRMEAGLSAFLLATGCWLLFQARSSTALACTGLGAVVLVILRSGLVNTRQVSAYAVAGLAILFGLEALFDPYEAAVAWLGRDPTLTDRTKLWADTFAMVRNPMVGTGFESFWLGDRLHALWAKWHWQPNQAHNGYLETYLNLGWVGVALLAAVLVSTFRGISRDLRTDNDFPSLRMALLVAIIAYNYTEAAFKGVHLVWTMFFIIALQYRFNPGRRSAEANSRRSGGAPSGHAAGPVVVRRTRELRR